MGGKLIYKLVDNFSVKFIRLKRKGGGGGEVKDSRPARMIQF